LRIVDYPRNTIYLVLTGFLGFYSVVSWGENNGWIVLLVSTKRSGQRRIHAIKPQYISLPACEIVLRAEALFGGVDAVEREVAAATKRAEALIQMVLDKAFAGKL